MTSKKKGNKNLWSNFYQVFRRCFFAFGNKMISVSFDVPNKIFGKQIFKFIVVKYRCFILFIYLFFFGINFWTFSFEPNVTSLDTVTGSFRDFFRVFRISLIQFKTFAGSFEDREKFEDEQCGFVYIEKEMDEFNW